MPREIRIANGTVDGREIAIGLAGLIIAERQRAYELQLCEIMGKWGLLKA